MSIQIQNIKGLTVADLHNELITGGRSLTYQYCISFLFITFRPPSDIYFIRSNQSAVLRGLPYVILSLLFGWWGLPWGPVYTISSIISNCKGGNDVTDDVLTELFAHPPITIHQPVSHAA